MSIETWGDMNKSQTDATLIETRISEMIQEHDDDPTAHLDAGQSLTTHRASEILDHPASSVVPDKFSNNQPSYQNYFVSATTYDFDGNVTQDGNGLILVVANNLNNDSAVRVPIMLLDSLNLTENDCLFDFVCTLVRTGSVSYSGLLSVGDDYDGFGISFNQTHFRLFYAKDGDVVYSSYIESVLTGNHTYRLFASLADLKFYLYIDGTLIISLDFPSGGINAGTFFNLYLHCTASGGVQGGLYMLRGFYSLN